MLPRRPVGWRDLYAQCLLDDRTRVDKESRVNDGQMPKCRQATSLGRVKEKKNLLDKQGEHGNGRKPHEYGASQDVRLPRVGARFLFIEIEKVCYSTILFAREIFQS